MNLYKISTGQLITIWVFGVLFWIGDILFSLDSSPSGLALVLLLLIPAALVFYTIGWKKLKKLEHPQKKKKRRITEYQVIIISISLGLVIFIGVIVYVMMNSSDSINSKKDKVYDNYLQGIKIDTYGADIVHTGGVGSQNIKITAYLLTEHGYLKPTKDWIKISFDSDLLLADCKDGYSLLVCDSITNKAWIEKGVGCMMQISNTPKLTPTGSRILDDLAIAKKEAEVNIECVKK